MKVSDRIAMPTTAPSMSATTPRHFGEWRTSRSRSSAPTTTAGLGSLPPRLATPSRRTARSEDHSESKAGRSASVAGRTVTEGWLMQDPSWGEERTEPATAALVYAVQLPRERLGSVSPGQVAGIGGQAKLTMGNHPKALQEPDSCLTRTVCAGFSPWPGWRCRAV